MFLKRFMKRFKKVSKLAVQKGGGTIQDSQKGVSNWLKQSKLRNSRGEKKKNQVDPDGAPTAPNAPAP